MRTTQLRPARQALNLVNSPKCLTAIPAKSALHRDVLVQSVLDPHVRSVELLRDVRSAGRVLCVNAIVIRRDDGAFMLEIPGHNPPRDVEQEELLFYGLKSQGISLMRLDLAEIRSEPRLSSAREIWDYRNFDVLPGDRSTIVSVLAEYGPRSIASLEDVAPLRRDVTSSVYSMACENLVEIDIGRRPLGPHTIVRARR